MMMTEAFSEVMMPDDDDAGSPQPLYVVKRSEGGMRG